MRGGEVGGGVGGKSCHLNSVERKREGRMSQRPVLMTLTRDAKIDGKRLEAYDSDNRAMSVVCRFIDKLNE